MEQVTGTISLVLNGRPLAPVSAETSHYEIELTDLPERNTLVLEIERPDAGLSAVGTCENWGMIALVVRTVDLDTTPLASPKEST